MSSSLVCAHGDFHLISAFLAPLDVMIFPLRSVMKFSTRLELSARLRRSCFSKWIFFLSLAVLSLFFLSLSRVVPQIEIIQMRSRRGFSRVDYCSFLRDCTQSTNFRFLVSALSDSDSILRIMLTCSTVLFVITVIVRMHASNVHSIRISHSNRISLNFSSPAWVTDLS